MNTKKALIIGCATCAMLAVAVFVVAVLFVVYVGQDVEGVAISVNGPTDVVVGQSFDLEVTVKNERSSPVLQLSDIDIADEYLAGFTVSSIKPTPKSNTHVPIDNSRSFTFDVTIPAGESRSFIFTLRAEVPGIYSGDVDACEGLRFVTGMAQTVVKEKE